MDEPKNWAEAPKTVETRGRPLMALAVAIGGMLLAVYLVRVVIYG
jgi:hypothetical protein